MKAERKSRAPRRGLAKILPHPLLSLCILLMWLMLTEASLGQFLLGLAAALLCGFAMARLDPPKLRIRRPHLLIVLLCRALWDSILSNLALIKIILTPGGGRASGFIALQLELRNPMAIAVLAAILAATPGTAWTAYDPAGGKLVLHILNLDGKTDWQSVIHRRYESLLLRIFP